MMAIAGVGRSVLRLLDSACRVSITGLCLALYFTPAALVACTGGGG